MSYELQKLKEELKTVNIRCNSMNELIDLKMKEMKSLYSRKIDLEEKISELERA
jgi:hypothetical protein